MAHDLAIYPFRALVESHSTSNDLTQRKHATWVAPKSLLPHRLGFQELSASEICSVDIHPAGGLDQTLKIIVQVVDLNNEPH